MDGAILVRSTARLAQNLWLSERQFKLTTAPNHMYTYLCILPLTSNGPNLVRYFEKLVRDEVSSSSSAHDSLHDWHDHNLMQPPHNDISETLQDCIDFDELMNDFHSTAASAQLLQRSLSGSTSLPF